MRSALLGQLLSEVVGSKPAMGARGSPVFIMSTLLGISGGRAGLRMDGALE